MSNTPPQEPGEYKPPPAPATIAGQWTPQPAPGQAHNPPPAAPGGGGGYPAPPPPPGGGGGNAGGGGFPPPPGGGFPPPPGSAPPPPPPPGGGFPPPPPGPGYGQAPAQPQYGQAQPQYGQAPAYGGVATNTPDPQGRPLAEWWKRAVAAVIDGLIVGIPGQIISNVIGFGAAQSAQVTTDEFGNVIAVDGGGGLVAGILAAIFIPLILSAIYYSVLNGGAKGQTVGKMVMKIAVRDEATGGPIGIGKGFLRLLVLWLLSIPCGIPALISLLAPLWDKKKQTWQDKAVKSIVVEVG